MTLSWQQATIVDRWDDSLCGPETLPWFSRFNIKLL